jgi:probable rRNA maturation factor
MEITLKNLQKKISIPQNKVLKAAKAASRTLQILQGGLSIVFVGTKRMRAINKKYLKHDHVTDVLTFDMGENTGEIIICPRVAWANAREHQTSTEKEIVLYVVHGILHLAGYDDHSEKDILTMRNMEKRLLKQ